MIVAIIQVWLFNWQEGNAKVQTFGKRCQSAKRDPNCPVVIRGWLNKKVLLLQTVSNVMSSQKAVWLTCNPFSHMQDSAGLKLWKRRWFVLSNYCLFYYKGNAACRSALGFCQILLKKHSSSPVAVFFFFFFNNLRQQRRISSGQHPPSELQDPLLHAPRMQEQKVHLQGNSVVKESMIKTN